MRIAKDTDFIVELRGVGKFRFGRRTFGDRIAIRREYIRLTSGQTGDTSLAWLSSVVASYMVLCVSCPAGWENVEEVDVLDREGFEDSLLELHDLLGVQEDSFRKGANKNVQGGGAGNTRDDAVLVPAEVPASADGPALSGNDA